MYPAHTDCTDKTLLTDSRQLMHKNLVELDPQVDEIMVRKTNCFHQKVSG